MNIPLESIIVLSCAHDIYIGQSLIAMHFFTKVEATSSGLYIGVHDGHGGVGASKFLNEHLFNNLKGIYKV